MAEKGATIIEVDSDWTVKYERKIRVLGDLESIIHRLFNYQEEPEEIEPEPVPMPAA